MTISASAFPLGLTLSVPALALVLAAIAFTTAAGYVWVRRGTSGWASLALMLLAGALYSLTYALELNSPSPEVRQLWGDVKYVGVCLLPITWLAFTLQYMGRGHRLTKRVFAVLAVEPLIVLALLAGPTTHDLVHVYPDGPTADHLPVIAFGPVGWAHVAYTYVLMLGATALFVVTLARTASPYERPARVLIVALLVPWLLNVLYVFDVGDFGRMDTTPFGFLLAGMVLVWGIFRLRLVELAPEARRVALDTMADAVVVLDAYRRVVELNPAAQRTLRATTAQAVGRPAHLVFPPLGPLLHGASRDAEVHGEVSLAQPNGAHDYEVTILPLPDGDGRSSGELVVLRDITDRNDAVRRLRETEAKYRALVEQVPAVVYIDLPNEGDRTMYVSPQIESMLGLSPDEYISDPKLWDKHVHPDDRDRVMQTYRDAIRRGEPSSSEYRMIRPDGRVVWVRDDVVMLEQEPGRRKVIQGIMFDVTELKQAQERAWFLAYHDPLTGLPNRAMFEETLELALARSRRGASAVAVLYLDLDNFKLVNDSLGHTVGDEVLKQMVGRLRMAVRDTDLVGRQGGDEFLILLADLERGPADGPAPSEVAEAVAGRIHRELARPFPAMGNDLYLSASIGASLFPAHGTDAPTLLRTADSAMYRSKKSGPGGYALFAPASDEAGDRLARVTALRRATEVEDQWALHYQPVVDLSDGRVVGAEALLRWRRPDGTLVPPAEFIPIAEELGFITRIGDWVLAKMCRQARDWRDAGLDLSVGFNLSVRQLWQRNFATHVDAYLDAYGIPPSSVVAEITESVATTDPDRTSVVVRELSSLGVRIAIDDFGTGYSSLSRLASLPVDVLKLDRSFIAAIPDDPQAMKMANAVIHLALSLGMEPLAEGVETEAQRRFLASKGCLFAQGFLWTPAVPADEFVEWVRRRSSAGTPVPSR
ncbi:MAG: EAL domain-containing protein [Actinomycetota bacterium]